MVDDGLATTYTFAKGENKHYICNTCGCQVAEARHVSIGYIAEMRGRREIGADSSLMILKALLA
jgi:hypothetical protein